MTKKITIHISVFEQGMVHACAHHKVQRYHNVKSHPSGYIRFHMILLQNLNGTDCNTPLTHNVLKGEIILFYFF